MIETEKQYQAARKKVDQMTGKITTIQQNTYHHPVRNRLMLAALRNNKKEIEMNMVLYESFRKNKI